MRLSRYALRTKLLALALLPLAATFVFAALWLSHRVDDRDRARDAADRTERAVLLSDLMFAISLDGVITLGDTAEGQDVVGSARGLMDLTRRVVRAQIAEQIAAVEADEPYYRSLLGAEGWRNLQQATAALGPLRDEIAATSGIRGARASERAQEQLVERYRRANDEVQALLLRLAPSDEGASGGLVAVPGLVLSQVLALREGQTLIRLMVAGSEDPALLSETRELAGRREQLLDTLELATPIAFSQEIAWLRGGPTEEAWERLRDRALVAGGIGPLHADRVARDGSTATPGKPTDVVLLMQTRVAGFDGLRKRLAERVVEGAQAEAERAQRELVTSILALIALSLVVVIVCVTVIRSTSRTVSSLLDRAGRIRAGELDVAPVAISGNDELGRLGRAFDEMASTLRAVDHQARALADGRFEESDSERLPGRIGGAISQSVTRLRDATEAVLARERLARAIVDGAAEAIWTIDRDGVVRSANAVAADMSGLPVDRVVGGRAVDVLPPELAALDAREGGLESIETRITPAGADTRHILLTARLVEDEGGGALVTLFARDISERKEYEDLLAFEASHDPLTGLANRAGVLARIQSALGRTATGGRRFALLFVDLDRFKNVNDALGHRAGDALLMAAGRRLAEVARDTDLVGRIGGDEFVVVIDPLDPLLDVDARARHLLAHLTRPFEIEGHSALVSASVGITVEDGSASDAVEVLQHADMAMYAAKRDGPGAVGLYDEQIRERARERSDIEERLRDALANDELRAYYQPIVDIADGQVAGAELLARWPTADGFVSPGEFIPVAEETGLVVDIGRWALREACTLLARGAERRELWVSVNISADHLAGSDLHAHVEEALAASGADPRRLVIEITETSLMGAGEAFARLERIRDLGVRVAIDDFGTGYSSLAYLRRLPVDVVKIDRAFVRDARTDRVAEAIIRMVNSIAADLGVETIAEGIETVEDRRALRALGARLAQGFLFTPALPADELARWKERWRREGGSPG